MTYWKNLHLTNQTITGLSLSINVVYPPEFESNIHNELQHLKTIYQCSQLFKKEVLAEAKLEQLHSDLASLKQQLEQSFGQELPSVLPARFGSETTVFLYTENSSSDWVLKQLGLKSALPLSPTLWGTKQMRIDQLKDLADAYFLYILPFNEEAKLKKSFLWQAMPFVRAKHYNSVAPVWSFGGAMSLRYTAEAYTKSLLEIAQ